MRKIIKLLFDSLAITQISNLFNDDAHFIVSKKGWIELEKLNQNKDERFSN